MSTVSYFHRLGETCDSMDFNRLYWMSASERPDIDSTGIELSYGPLLNEIKRLAPACEGNSILEIGCGTGDVLKYLSEEGYVVTGLEKSEIPAEIARMSGLEVYGISGTDVQSVPGIGERKFDCVFMHRVIEDPVMSEYDASRLSASALRALKKGRPLIASTRNGVIHKAGFMRSECRDTTEKDAYSSYVGRILVTFRS